MLTILSNPGNAGLLSYLNGIFKKEFTRLFQTSPGKWLVRKRLDYARNLLISSEKNVNEIACDCGFESATHFRP